MTTQDLMVEVGTEEIPAGYMAPALAALEERLAAELKEANLTHDGLKTWVTPRRIAFAVRSLPEQQPDMVKEVTGPPVRAAYDANGQPTRAAVGFAANQGVDVTDLMTIETKKGPYLAVRQEVKGRPAAEVLGEIIPPLVLGLPFPKTMRWGDSDLTFVRPIHWLLCVFGGKILPAALGAIEAGGISYGHRFMHPGALSISSPDQYEDRMAEAHVIVDPEKRRTLVKEEIRKASLSAGESYQVLEDEELVDEVANLVEKPVGCLGRFEESFLRLPSEVLVTAMREHQRYFALTDRNGALAPYFIAINNTEASDMNMVARGHERVLRARLDDARFYFEEDAKTTLEFKQAELKRVVYHSLLGTSWEKVQRFTAVAGFLADRLDPEVKPDLMRAAALCKCDLVSGVVSEFPALQGLMGREYALRDGESQAVADAIAEHYKPTHAGGELPNGPVGALLSMADKMDTICGCFGVGLIPTGGADPYALRRQALGVIHIILDRQYRVDLSEIIDCALEQLTPWLKSPADKVKAEVLEFFRLRLKNLLTGQGASTDGAEAVLSLHHEDVVAAIDRVWALESVKAQPDFDALAAAFKRVGNIIKKFGAETEFDPDKVVVQQEKDLADAAADLEKRAESLAEADDYTGLMQAIVGIKPTVDAFFDHVLVDDPDPAVKNNRLALLARLSAVFEMVADFGKVAT